MPQWLVRRSSALRSSIAIALLVVQLAGCFTYVPAGGSALSSGAQVTVGITDRGRLALEERVGPGVLRLGGQVLAATDTAVVLSVSSVQYLDLAVPVRWAGERVVVSRDHVAEIRERRLSRSRSWLMAGVVAVAAFAASQIAISGFGSDSEESGNGGNGNSQ